jgi:hypothetical protein
LPLELGGDADQVPAQPVDHPSALGDQLVAIVGQHPDLHRMLIEIGGGQLIDPDADRGQRDRGRVDQIRLARRA